MSTITKARPAKQAVLTETDVKLLKEREGLRAELKRLDDYLKPRIEATIQVCGWADRPHTGRVCIGESFMDLTTAVRLTTSWKACCYALANEAEVDAVRGDFTLESTSYSAKVVEEA